MITFSTCLVNMALCCTIFAILLMAVAHGQYNSLSSFCNHWPLHGWEGVDVQILLSNLQLAGVRIFKTEAKGKLTILNNLLVHVLPLPLESVWLNYSGFFLPLLSIGGYFTNESLLLYLFWLWILPLPCLPTVFFITAVSGIEEVFRLWTTVLLPPVALCLFHYKPLQGLWLK